MERWGVGVKRIRMDGRDGGGYVWMRMDEERREQESNLDGMMVGGTHEKSV